jgi:hypothetical protein
MYVCICIKDAARHAIRVFSVPSRNHLFSLIQHPCVGDLGVRNIRIRLVHIGKSQPAKNRNLSRLISNLSWLKKITQYLSYSASPVFLPCFSHFSGGLDTSRRFRRGTMSSLGTWLFVGQVFTFANSTRSHHTRIFDTSSPGAFERNGFHGESVWS